MGCEHCRVIRDKKVIDHARLVFPEEVWIGDRAWTETAFRHRVSRKNAQYLGLHQPSAPRRLYVDRDLGGLKRVQGVLDQLAGEKSVLARVEKATALRDAAGVLPATTRVYWSDLWRPQTPPGSIRFVVEAPDHTLASLLDLLGEQRFLVRAGTYSWLTEDTWQLGTELLLARLWKLKDLHLV